MLSVRRDPETVHQDRIGLLDERAILAQIATPAQAGLAQA
ncbi:hypothetical protein CSIRO_0974 [Bradyrhizobiaceae bacterium SG-6C]|nr:hypothetical protein CSIRO_0974 [Bradyrhizobiaceae bacterium SG-6C]